jgi:hypothetical protein
MKTYRVEYRYPNGEIEYARVQARSFDDAEDRLARNLTAAGIDARKVDVVSIDELTR